MDPDYDPESSFAYKFIRYNFSLVSVVVLIFDHCLTFSAEVEHIWNKRKTPFSCLFLLNRYFSLGAMLAYTTLYIIPQKGCPRTFVEYLAPGAYTTISRWWEVSFPFGTPRLTMLVEFSGAATPLLFAFTVVTTLAAEAIITLRAYAAYQRRILILLILSAIWITHLALLIKVYIHSIGYVDTSQPQAPGLDLIESKGILFVAPAVVFDAIAGSFLTLGLYHQSRLHQIQMPLIKLMIRDGILYFVVVFVSNCIWLAVHVLGHREKRIPLLDFTPIEIWCGCITTTMIGRLTLNLKMYDPLPEDRYTAKTMSLRFRHSQHTTTNPMEDETRDRER